MPGERTVCTFSGSSARVDPVYFDAAGDLGRRLARQGWRMVYGGGAQGLMGAVARGVHEVGGHVTAIIPRSLNKPGIVYETADEIIVTETLRERKQLMDDRANAFIALPGGFGTLEELIEVVALKQLKYHARAIAVLNTAGFYDPLLSFIDAQVRVGYVRSEHRNLFGVFETPEAVVDYLESYAPDSVADKYGIA